MLETDKYYGKQEKRKEESRMVRGIRMQGQEGGCSPNRESG